MLAELRRTEGDRSGATREVRQLLHKRPDQIEALQLYSLLLLDQGQGRDALGDGGLGGPPHAARAPGRQEGAHQFRPARRLGGDEGGQEGPQGGAGGALQQGGGSGDKQKKLDVVAVGWGSTGLCTRPN